ncbi:unnamed protein product [Scytosiphon promiscuus]
MGSGVTTADFPKAFIAHEFLSVAFLALTWAACYQIQPSQVIHPGYSELDTIK